MVTVRDCPKFCIVTSCGISVPSFIKSKENRYQCFPQLEIQLHPRYFHVVTVEFKEFILSWHQGLYSGVEEIVVSFVTVWRSLLRVDVCRKSLASEALRKGSKDVEVIWPHITVRTGVRLHRHGREVVDRIPSTPDVSLDDSLCDDKPHVLRT